MSLPITSDDVNPSVTKQPQLRIDHVRSSVARQRLIETSHEVGIDVIILWTEFI